jgi:hypothetical protein
MYVEFLDAEVKTHSMCIDPYRASATSSIPEAVEGNIVLAKYSALHFTLQAK